MMLDHRTTREMQKKKNDCNFRLSVNEVKPYRGQADHQEPNCFGKEGCWHFFIASNFLTNC